MDNLDSAATLHQ